MPNEIDKNEERRKSLENKITELKRISALMNDECSEHIEYIEDMFYDNNYKVAVIGEFSTGKSTFINALIGKKILYSSNTEATGVITSLRNDDSAYAEIYGKNSRRDIENKLLDRLDLNDKEAVIKLNSYLDINNKSGAGSIDVYYPLDGIDKEIIFLDTPGIENLSPDQMKMTADLLKTVNAVIFLINTKGFKGSSMEILEGKNKIIGKIPVKDLFIVMTKIGEIYDNEKDISKAEERINNAVKEVLFQLEERGFQDKKIFTADSLDYLMYKDEALYNEMVKIGEVQLTREELRARSRFDDFKKELTDFLHKDNRIENRFNDIDKKIKDTVDLLSEFLGERNDSLQSENEQKLSRLNDYINKAALEKRKFLNNVIRQVKSNISDFEDSVEKDIKEENKNNNGISGYVDKKFKSLKDLTELKVSECSKYVDDTESAFYEDIKRNIDEYKNDLLKTYVTQIFDSEFKGTFGRNVLSKKFVLDEKAFRNIEFDVKTLKRKAVSVNNDDLEKERNRLLEEKRKLKEDIDKTEREVNREHETLLKRKNETEKRFAEERAKLGKRPEPRQKYRTEEYSTGHLWWKKWHTRQIPDGLDDSECKKWDEKNKRINADYDNRLDQIEEAINKAENKISRVKGMKGEYELKQRNIESVDKMIENRKKAFEKIERENEAIFLGRKKSEILDACIKKKNDMSEDFRSTAEKYLDDLKDEVSAEIKKQTERIIESYKNSLYSKREEALSKIDTQEDTNSSLLSRLEKLKEAK